VLSTGHDIRAASDSSERPCDGEANNPEYTRPGPTPTAAAVDAMSIVGDSFDGQWYPGYDDYFLTRWGPDAEAEGMSWGVLVNDVFTNVGGCQYELGDGDGVLWAYDAFAGRPILALYPAGDGGGTPPLTVTVEPGKPLTVEVRGYTNAEEGEPPPAPTRAGSIPDASAYVSPASTTTKGFERVQTGDPATVRTDAEGRATITFATPGWPAHSSSAGVRG